MIRNSVAQTSVRTDSSVTSARLGNGWVAGVSSASQTQITTRYEYKYARVYNANAGF